MLSDSVSLQHPEDFGLEVARHEATELAEQLEGDHVEVDLDVLECTLLLMERHTLRVPNGSHNPFAIIMSVVLAVLLEAGELQLACD